MFSRIYQECFAKIKSEKRSGDYGSSLEKILRLNKEINIEDVAEVLYSALKDESKKTNIIDVCAANRFEKFHNKLSVIIPQYQSSKCVDDCKYCGFRKSNTNMLRAVLNDRDFEKEINLMIDWGYRCIEFVYATDPDFTPERIGKRVQTAKRIGDERGFNLRIGLNANTFDVDGYKTLKDYGLDFMVLWVETYTEKYKNWHPQNTPKGNFTNRIDTFDRVLRGGIDKFGCGVLFGLGDWMHDVLMLIAHGLYLRKTYGVDPYIMGIPRLKHAMGLSTEKSRWIIDDRNYELICSLYKLVFPETKLFVNTRERFEENERLISGGGDLFTIDCGTFPGAYLKPKLIFNGFEQFHTQHYEREKIIQSLKRKGFVPVFSW